MRVFLDTNVLASAFATRGLCADLYREVIFRHELATSPSVLDELRDVFARKFRLPDKDAVEILQMLRTTSIVEQSKIQHRIAISDSDDCVVLSSAIESEAEVFVTGDKEIQELGDVGEMKILSPRGLWEELKRRNGKPGGI